VAELDKNLNENQDKKRHVRHPDWRLISSFGYVFGLLFLIIGIYVYLYYKTTWIGQLGLAFQPYQNYAIPILIIGIALLIIGFIAENRDRKKIKSVKNNNRQQT
jgi:predicted transporter